MLLKDFPLEYIKKRHRPLQELNPAPQLFSTTNPIQLKIKQKYLSTFSLADQPKILNHTKFFSSKLKALPAQPNPKSEIPNPNKKNKLFSHHLKLLPKFLIFTQSCLCALLDGLISCCLNSQSSHHTVMPLHLLVTL